VKDLFASGEELFAVGEHGLFYHVHGVELTRIESPTTETLKVVWARNPAEVYAVGDSGVVLHFDGTELRLLRKPVASKRGLVHAMHEPQDMPARLDSVWASSPVDVWVAGWPYVLLHFDSSGWKEIDIGARRVIVRSLRRSQRQVVLPVVGPVWGSGPDDVWVRKEVVRHVEPGLDRPPLMAFHELGNVLMHFDGEQWIQTAVELPLETAENQGRGPPTPEILALSPNSVWTRFDNALHLWRSEGAGSAW
jgi:hypothetical protein